MGATWGVPLAVSTDASFAANAAGVGVTSLAARRTAKKSLSGGAVAGTWVLVVVVAASAAGGKVDATAVGTDASGTPPR